MVCPFNIFDVIYNFLDKDITNSFQLETNTCKRNCPNPMKYILKLRIVQNFEELYQFYLKKLKNRSTQCFFLNIAILGWIL